jgi:hypothetical protein
MGCVYRIGAILQEETSLIMRQYTLIPNWQPTHHQVLPQCGANGFFIKSI